MTNPYRIRSSQTVQMLGRERLLKQILEQLTKSTPDHLSIIGPKLIGKTVLMDALQQRLHGNEGYIAAVKWDFRSHLPQTDEAFLQHLAGLLKDSLRAAGSDIADYLDPKGADVLGDLGLAIDELSQSEQRILVLLDGFDAVLAADNLTRTLWDNLLDLARKDGLRLVTASRGRLRELLKHNARPSIFWEIFAPQPVTVGPFTPDEIKSLISPFADRGITFDPSAEKELFNETGGHPVFCAAILSSLFDTLSDRSSVSGDSVKQCATNAASGLQEVFADIWDDCYAIEAGLVMGKLAQGDISSSDISPDLATALSARGLAVIMRDHIRSGSRMFAVYARAQAPRATNLMHLFGSQAGYDSNIRDVLQLRLSQIGNLDAVLRNDILRAIRDLAPEPRHSVNCLRGIALTALALIWKAELEPGDIIPQSWINEWKQISGKLALDVVTSAQNGDRRLPASAGKQCGILNLATGTQDARRVTRHITKQTYLLLDHVQSGGDYGQHQSEPVDIGFASALCLSAIELARRLAIEIPTD